MSDKYQIC